MGHPPRPETERFSAHSRTRTPFPEPRFPFRSCNCLQPFRDLAARTFHAASILIVAARALEKIGDEFAVLIQIGFGEAEFVASLSCIVFKNVEAGIFEF